MAKSFGPRPREQTVRCRLARPLLVLAFLAAVGCSDAPKPAMSGPSQQNGRPAQHIQEPRLDGPTGGARNLGGPVRVDQIDCTPSGRDPRRVGVVVIHAAHTFGRTQDDAKGQRVRSIEVLAAKLRRAGFQVVAPEMPWTLAHPYDRRSPRRPSA